MERGKLVRWVIVPVGTLVMCWSEPALSSFLAWLTLTVVGVVAIALADWMRGRGLAVLGAVVAMLLLRGAADIWLLQGRVGPFHLMGGLFVALALLGTYLVQRQESRAEAV
jgi:drug/metabolite transporter (DMT)-like permease